MKNGFIMKNQKMQNPRKRVSDSEYLWNAVFLTYLVILTFVIIVFFYLGYLGVSHLSYLDISGAYNRVLETYAPQAYQYSIWTMTPLYTICAAETAIWIFAAVFGFFQKPGWTYRLIFAFFTIMGVTIWFYSIF